MTHFSDFTYLQRCTAWVYLGGFLLYSVWSSDRFRCLHPKKIINGELRSIITILYIMMLMMQASWDVVGVWIKYSEKYIVIPGTTDIVGTPYQLWTLQHQRIAQSMDYIECVNLSMQTGVLVLLQCFWNYLSNNFAKRSFMTSFEFKFYIFWALASVVVFPVLQWNFRDSVSLREAIPLLLYSFEALVIAGLGVRSHYRFTNMLDYFMSTTHSSGIIYRLSYFKDLNILMTVAVFFYGLSLGIMTIDGITPAQTIGKNKFATDILMANGNTCAILMWIIGIMIFHPTRSSEEFGSSTMGRRATHNHIQGDIEISRQPSQSIGVGITTEEIKSRRDDSNINPRVASFIENNSSNQIDLSFYDPTLTAIISKDGNKVGGLSFLRPMNPVEIDSASISPKIQSNSPIPNRTVISPANTEKFRAGHGYLDSAHRSGSPLATSLSNEQIALQNQSRKTSDPVDGDKMTVKTANGYSTNWLSQTPERRKS